MRPFALHGVVAIIAAASLLSACSAGAPQSNSVALPPTATNGNRALPTSANAQSVRIAGSTRTVYVAQQSQNNLLKFQYSNRNFTEIGAVPGATGGYGLWVDREKNLYVSNYGAVSGSIAEYNELGDPIFTYSSGIGSVQAVTTDQYGNVFEADLDNSVREFPSGVNTAIATCTPPAATQGAWGVAVDRQGDVFVDYADSTGSGNLIEYPHGLGTSGCHGTDLFGSPGGVFSGPGGIALDPQKDLVVCSFGGVFIIAPPYLPSSNETALGTGYDTPVNVTITKNGTQAYVTDTGYGFTRLVRYPSGTTIAALTTPTYAPSAAVDSDNYVP